MIKRRRFLQSTAFTAGALIVPASLWNIASAKIIEHPFALGVASGMPGEDSIVLWTRLLTRDGLQPFALGDVAVRWELSEDESFTRVFKSGIALAQAAWAHSIHAEVDTLPAGRWFYYRFILGDAISAVGRTRTMPASREEGSLRFILASCQNYQHGYFSALDHAAGENPDLVIWVGDYIYEYGPLPNAFRLDRLHPSGECRTLDDYRRRYVLYKTEKPLQHLHATCPWVITWDDHEVENDYANDRGNKLPQPDFLQRRAAAYRAWYEHMPVRKSLRPQGPEAIIYGALRIGSLAQFYVLDNRQYRSHQVCARAGRGGSATVSSECIERLNPNLTLLGTQQESWLQHSLAQSKTRWNIIAQQTLMCYLDQDPDKGGAFWTDGWNGYPAARTRLFNDIVSSKVRNPIVLGGDVHAHYVNELRLGDKNQGRFVAAEFVGTSITSRSSWSQAKADQIAAYNPHVKYSRVDKRGYVLFNLNTNRLQVQLKAVDDVEQLSTFLSTVAVFEVYSDQGPAQRIA